MRKSGNQSENTAPALTIQEGGGDEECLLGNGSSYARSPASAFPTRSSNHSPAIVILRKILSFFVFDNGSTNRGIVGFSHDVIIGIVLTVFTVVFLMILDITGVIRLQSMQELRVIASKQLKNPETVKFLEEASGLKIMMSEEYEVIKDSTMKFVELLEEKRVMLEEKTKAGEEEKSKVEPMQKEKEELIKKLELDKWCASCEYKRGLSCNARLDYTAKKQNNGGIKGQVSIMRDDPQCKKA